MWACSGIPDTSSFQLLLGQLDLDKRAVLEKRIVSMHEQVLAATYTPLGGSGQVVVWTHCRRDRVCVVYLLCTNGGVQLIRPTTHSVPLQKYSCLVFGSNLMSPCRVSLHVSLSTRGICRDTYKSVRGVGHTDT